MRNDVLSQLVTHKRGNQIEGFETIIHLAGMHNMLDYYPSEKKTNKVSFKLHNNYPLILIVFNYSKLIMVRNKFVTYYNEYMVF